MRTSRTNVPKRADDADRVARGDAPSTIRGPVSTRVNAERLVVLGWSRAILMQFAHPLIAAGVHDHSGFRTSPLAALRRLHHTIGAMLALSFGTPDSCSAALEGIRAIHRRVHGHLPETVGPYPAGTRYSAEDPALVRWVHLTLLESIVLVHDRFVRPLTPAERDAYCQESAWVPIALGARDEEVPRTWESLTRALAAEYAAGRIVVGRTARALAEALLWPRGFGIAAPVMWANRILTVGLLPPGLRDGYGFAWSPGRERALRVLTVLLRLARRLLPVHLTHWREAWRLHVGRTRSGFEVYSDLPAATIRRR